MVVFLVKNSNEDQFLFESTTAETNDNLIRKLVHMWNTRLQINRLVLACRGLMTHGPSKPPKEHGLDSILEESGVKIKKGPFYNADPTGQRTGNRCDPKLGAVIEKTCTDALQAISAKQVTMRVALTPELLKEKIDNIGGAVTIAYPMGLPEWDPVPLILQDKDEVAGADFKKILDPATATLWFAGKEFLRDGVVKDRIRHEKTKVTVKLQKKGSSAPARQPAVSEAERKAMMAHYFKKQEEMKKLAENDEDDYLHSSWANPNRLKNSLHGTSSGVMFRAGGRRL